MCSASECFRFSPLSAFFTKNFWGKIFAMAAKASGALVALRKTVFTLPCSMAIDDQSAVKTALWSRSRPHIAAMAPRYSASVPASLRPAANPKSSTSPEGFGSILSSLPKRATRSCFFSKRCLRDGWTWNTFPNSFCPASPKLYASSAALWA